MSLTHLPNGLDTTVVRDGEEKTADYTVVVSDDSGKTFFIQNNNDVIFTLPAIAIGETYTFVNLNGDGTGLLTISPNASDGIVYDGALDDDMDLINTLATQLKGDAVTIAALDGVIAWQVTYATGIWAKEV